MVSKRKLPTKEEMGGLDPALLLSLSSKIKPNPVTGKTDLSDIMNYMAKHPDEMATFMSQMSLSPEKPFDPKNMLDTHKFIKSIKANSLWVMQMENMGLVDNQGRGVEPGSVSKEAQKALKTCYMLYIYDETGSYRVTQEVTGNVTAEHVLKALYQAITAPIVPLKPGLPNMFMVSLRYKPHESALKKYLDTLPHPFTWRFETEEESMNVASGVSDLNEKGIAIYRSRSETFKKLGNDAFKKKDRKAAVAAYTQAIGELEEAFELAHLEIDDEAKADAEKALAVCYANRAAAWIIDGPGLDAGKALEDGRASERMDKTYAKAYYRQAKALVSLEQKTKGQEVLIRGLSLPQLENDNSLVGFLIELQTQGKGLPQEEGVFNQWLQDLDKGPSPSRLKGEWKKRCDAIRNTFKHVDA